MINAFLAGVREGDFDALLALLDPDVVHRADRAAAPPDGSEVRSAAVVAKRALAGSRRAASAPPALALVNGAVGVVVAPRGRLSRVVTFKVRRGKFSTKVADRERLRQLDLAVLND